MKKFYFKLVDFNKDLQILCMQQGKWFHSYIFRTLHVNIYADNSNCKIIMGTERL